MNKIQKLLPNNKLYQRFFGPLIDTKKGKQHENDFFLFNQKHFNDLIHRSITVSKRKKY